MPPLINTFGVASARSFGFANLRNTSVGGWIRGETTPASSTIGLGVQVTSSGIYVAEGANSSTGTTNGVMNLTGAGAITWNKNFTYTSNNGRAWNVGVDSSGNIYALVNPSTGLLGVVKMDSSGSFVYFRQLSNTYIDTTSSIPDGRGLYVDKSGSNLYICGKSSSSSGSNVFTSVTQASPAVNFSRTAGTAGTTNVSRCIASDSSGNVYIGMASSTLFGLMKVNSTGTVQWSRSGNTPNCIDIDSSGNIYLSTIAGQTTAFNSSGTVLWQNTRTSSTATSFVAYDIAVDLAGNVYVVGRNSSTPNVGNIIKYNSSGVVQWSSYIQVNAGSQVATSLFGVSVDETNSRIIVTGGSNTLGGSCPFYVAALPMDGSGTGAYVISSWTYTYANYTSASGTDATWSTASVTPSSASPTYTDTSQVTGLGSNTIATSLTSF